MSRIDESKEFFPVRIAVLTVSDTRSLAEDRSGDTLVARLTEARAQARRIGRSCPTSGPRSPASSGNGSPIPRWTLS